ncbi:hypothetical protein GYA54_02830 [Candidatus Kuenenbacteria bacterium]|nr:hypothetical protein [Candidatus Kuenenbacteria bacterium]
MTEDQQKTMEPLSWSFPEHEKHERSRRWYIIAGLIAAFLFVYALLTSNWLFALIIIMVIMVMFINHHSEPRPIEFIIDHEGIKLGEKHYKYKDIKNFWIIYEPPTVKKIFFVFMSNTKPILSIPIGEENPVDIRAFLRQYLEEDLDQEAEPFSEAMGRILKI